MCAMAVRLLGKRVLALSSIILSSILSILLGVYIEFQDKMYQPWLFIVLYIAQGFTHPCIVSTPWILIGEVYPLK